MRYELMGLIENHERLYVWGVDYWLRVLFTLWVMKNDIDYKYFEILEFILEEENVLLGINIINESYEDLRP